MESRLNLYYEEGNSLEITIANPPKKSYCGDISEDVFMRRDERTDDVVGIGIFNFSQGHILLA